MNNPRLLDHPAVFEAAPNKHQQIGNNPKTSGSEATMIENDDRRQLWEITVSVKPCLLVGKRASRLTLRTPNEWPGKIERFG
jgi:hypothetical protein